MSGDSAIFKLPTFGGKKTQETLSALRIDESDIFETEEIFNLVFLVVPENDEDDDDSDACHDKDKR